VNSEPPGPEEGIHRRFHSEPALRQVAVHIIVTGDDAARPDLGEPQLEILADRVLVVTGIDVDDVEAAGTRPAASVLLVRQIVLRSPKRFSRVSAVWYTAENPSSSRLLTSTYSSASTGTHGSIEMR